MGIGMGVVDGSRLMGLRLVGSMGLCGVVFGV